MLVSTKPESEKSKPSTAAKPSEVSFDDCFGDEVPKNWIEGGTPDIDGWWSPEEGLVFMGQIIASFVIDAKKPTDRDRDVVCVRLERPTKAIMDGEPKRLEPGDVLAVGISHALRQMLEYVEHQGMVFAKAKKKVSIGHGQTVWKYEHLRFKGKRAAPVKAPATNDDEIPF